MQDPAVQEIMHSTGYFSEIYRPKTADQKHDQSHREANPGTPFFPRSNVCGKLPKAYRFHRNNSPIS